MDKKESLETDRLPLSVLIVDDEPDFTEALAETLRDIDAVCESARTREETEEILGKKVFDVVMTDLMVGDEENGGFEILRRVRELAPETEVIIMTTSSKAESAAKAMKLGAFNYLTKPFENLQQLRAMVRRAGESSRLRRSNSEMSKRLDEKFGFNGVIGNSPAMHRAVERLKQVAPTNASVLILGETGTGKELFAQAIHQNSPRKNREYVKINCATLAGDLLTSELFGHVKGAFTGALTNKIGKFEYAKGGTIFLDEIGDMPLSTQAMLLRVLENHEITPLGSNETIKVDVRIIAATNKNLEEAVSNGEFRKDLYHRLALTLQIPPLRERVEDIPLLLDKFIRDFNREYGKEVRGVTPSARRKLASYSWPGNVRGLKNAVGAMVMFDTDGVIGDDDLVEARPWAGEGVVIEAPPPSFPEVSPVASLVGRSLADVERMLIEETLDSCGGNREEAARILGIAPRTLYRRLKEYDGVGEGETGRAAG